MFANQNVKLMNNQSIKDVIGGKQCFKLNFLEKKIYNKNNKKLNQWSNSGLSKRLVFLTKLIV